MANKYLEKALNHIREIQMETMVRYHYKPNRIIKIIKTEKTIYQNCTLCPNSITPIYILNSRNAYICSP